MTASPEFLYRYRQTLDHAESELAGILWAARPDTLNDPCEQFFKSCPNPSVVLRGSTPDQGVVCFSETCTDECMWAYYGDQQGYCIEYARSCQIVGRAERVKYLEPSAFSRARNHTEAVAYKTLPWQHEKEWRIVKPNPEKLCGVQIEGATVTGVVVGLKSPWAMREFFYYWTSEHHLRFGRICVDPEALCLRVKWRT